LKTEMPRVTIKGLKEYGREREMNSSREACDRVRQNVREMDVGQRLFGYAIDIAKSNGRKTVMEKDVEPFVRMYSELVRGEESVQQEVGEERRDEAEERREVEESSTKRSSSAGTSKTKSTRKRPRARKN
jgi:histone H3/H4